jgi:hypothetical protein
MSFVEVSAARAPATSRATATASQEDACHTVWLILLRRPDSPLTRVARRGGAPSRIGDA